MGFLGSGLRIKGLRLRASGSRVYVMDDLGCKP